MKKLNMKLIIIAAVLLAVSACSKKKSEDDNVSANKDTLKGTESLKNNDTPIYMQKTEITFDEVLDGADLIVKGTYSDKIEYDNYDEYKFDVSQVIYGNLTDSSILVFKATNIISEGVTSENSGGETDYAEGNEYVLFLKNDFSIFNDHKRYAFVTSDLFCPVDSIADVKLYGEALGASNVEELTSYINDYKGEAEPETSQQIYMENATPQTYMDVSDVISQIKIEWLEIEGLYNRAGTYRCTVDRVIYGNNINTYEDGTFYASLFAGSVEEGKSYVVCLKSTSEGSCVYRLAIEEGVFECDDDMVLEIEDIIK